MRAVISGGGTAGHINPALSIAKKIMEKEPGSEILFVGTPNGMENRLVTREGFPIRHVDVMGFRRKLTLENVKVAWKAVRSVPRAKKILKEFKPDVVIGTGGYVCWPVLRAAASMGLPTLIHEQNAIPGLTTSRLSGVVDRVCVSFEESRTSFPCKKDKIVLTGNPVDPAVGNLDRAAARRELGIFVPFILSYGGSLGARAINEAAFALAKEYTSKSPVFHTMAVGNREYETWKARAEQEEICRFGNVKVCDYIYDMPRQMTAADLVICRAGAITLAELSLIGTPAILIPSPNVTNNHQYKNAAVFRDHGAAILIEEKDLTKEKLIETVKDLIDHPEKRAEMSRNMKKQGVPGSADLIWNEIKQIAKQNEKGR